MCLSAQPSLSFLWVSSSGDVFLRDGTKVNHTLVKDGWCRLNELGYTGN